MSKAAGAIGVVLVLVASAAFAALNGNEWVTVDLGLATFYRVPLPYVAFGGLLVGMLVLLVAGIHSDLRVRRILRERLREEDLEEKARHDRYQRDLFKPDEEDDAS